MPDNPQEKPVVYIFHGDDELAINLAVESLLQQMGDSAAVEANVSRLDGNQHNLNDIRTAAGTLPFLSERRLVVFSYPLTRLKEVENQNRFCALLDWLPPSAALVLLVEDQIKRRRLKNGEWVSTWEELNDLESPSDNLKMHWLVKWSAEAGKRAYRKGFPLPEQGEMTGWIQKKARELGGQFSSNAAQELASLVENDTRLAAQEVFKLLTYANFERVVNVEDVQKLTASRGEYDVFEMVDSVAQRNTQKALELLRGLCEQQDGASLFPMVVRQFRLLLQAREILDEGGASDRIQRELQVAPFIAKKLNYQASRFRIEELEKIFRRLYALDESIKTGQLSAELALELFVVETGTHPEL